MRLVNNISLYDIMEVINKRNYQYYRIFSSNGIVDALCYSRYVAGIGATRMLETTDINWITSTNDGKIIWVGSEMPSKPYGEGIYIIGLTEKEKDTLSPQQLKARIQEHSDELNNNIYIGKNYC